VQQPDRKEIMILNRIVIYAVIAFFLVVAAIYLLFISGKTGQYTDFEDYIFGTYIKLRISSKVNPSTIAKAIFTEMRRLEKKFDPYSEGSVLYSINHSQDWVQVDDETLSVIDLALRFARDTEGAFDPTIGRLIDLWGFSKFTQNQSTKGFRIPSVNEIAEAASQSGYQKMAVDYTNKRVKTNGVWIDLGGMLKGYALKRAYQIAKEFDKSCHGFIEAGGQIMILGPKYNKTNWVIGIRDPRGEPGENIAIVYMSEGSIATSGDYERFFIVDNVRYHHILDPVTGYPANKAMSATIISEDPVVADALSTAAFVLGEDRWLFTRTVFPKYGAEVLLITPQKKLLRSDKFKIYEIADR